MGLWCQAGIPPIRLLHPTWLRIPNWNTTNGKIHLGEVPFGAPLGSTVSMPPLSQDDAGKPLTSLLYLKGKGLATGAGSSV